VTSQQVVLDLVVDQVQAYDNLIVLIVDSLKYLTPLSFDVLSCINNSIL
jgi:hypothetical protein